MNKYQKALNSLSAIVSLTIKEPKDAVHLIEVADLQELVDKEEVIRPQTPRSLEGLQGKNFRCPKCSWYVTYHQFYCDNCGQHLRERSKSQDE